MYSVWLPARWDLCIILLISVTNAAILIQAVYFCFHWSMLLQCWILFVLFEIKCITNSSSIKSSFPVNALLIDTNCYNIFCMAMILQYDRRQRITTLLLILTKTDRVESCVGYRPDTFGRIGARINCNIYLIKVAEGPAMLLPSYRREVRELTGFILDMYSANDSRRYNETSPLIDWAYTQNETWLIRSRRLRG